MRAAFLVIALGVWLGAGEANAMQPVACAADPVEQSICIYQAILADISKNYTASGGGGISSIVQDSTSAFTVHISQEGKQDILHYTVKVGPDGTVGIVEKTESTKSY